MSDRKLVLCSENLTRRHQKKETHTKTTLIPHQYHNAPHRLGPNFHFAWGITSPLTPLEILPNQLNAVDIVNAKTFQPYLYAQCCLYLRFLPDRPKPAFKSDRTRLFGKHYNDTPDAYLGWVAAARDADTPQVLARRMPKTSKN